MTDLKKTNLPLVTGSSGYKNYLAFAKNGKYVMSIKLAAAASGAKFTGKDDTTLFAARLRSAVAGDVFPDAEETVIGFRTIPQTPAEGWPHVLWDAKNDQRAATTVSIILNGTPNDDAGIALLLSQIDNKQLATKLADYLISVAGENNLRVSRDDMIADFDAYYTGFITAMKARLAAIEAKKKALEANIGVFAIQAELLKAAYKDLPSLDSYGEDDQSDEEPEEEGDDETDLDDSNNDAGAGDYAEDKAEPKITLS